MHCCYYFYVKSKNRTQICESAQNEIYELKKGMVFQKAISRHFAFKEISNYLTISFQFRMIIKHLILYLPQDIKLKAIYSFLKISI